MLEERIAEISMPEGFNLRPATLDDLEAAVEVFNACSRELIGVENKYTVEETGLEWREPGFDLQIDTRLAIGPDGRVAAYCEVWNPDEPYVIAYCWGRVLPEFTGLGIGSYLMDWGESRAREAIQKAPPEARVALRAFSLTSDEKAVRLFTRAGLTRVRYFFRMVIGFEDPPPEPEWPAGISVRTLPDWVNESGETINAVGGSSKTRAAVQAIRESFQDHWGYVDRPFEEEYARWVHMMENDKEFDPSLWFLALDGDDIAGVSYCKPKVDDDHEMGLVQTLGVRRPWRKRGLGLALLQHSFCEFYRRGLRKAGLGVDAENLTGALRLYEKAGMRSDPARQFSVYEKELRPGIDLSTNDLGV
jgi:mycothiol synthase